MTKADKTAAIEALKEKLETANNFYLTDSSTLTVGQVNKLRKLCYDNGIELHVVKNTLVRKAMDSFSEDRNYAALYDALHGPTAIMFSESAKAPATLIKQFRKDHERPVLKAAYIDASVFMGDEQIEVLVKLKSKEELLGEVVMLLQSPARNVISALQSGGQTIAGLVKALEERGGAAQ
ncbi:MAG: 50S ribosomal protein L10 [Saprospiraceae bacterium]|jgi:large subunit ribosomal protein L10|nr:50S ribosomal protein L10 [Saprospiraceae bacterium]HRF38172.1 50S ribosomal protein L10 [Saprospiraceae bacterium]HRJ16303.1 50S ribosomal protein L10 [Saprospiraceae bacterium]HRK81973.1 50S ribosomal protein L10 [Saprospiraceae bacterium]